MSGVEERADRDIGRLAAALGDPTRRRVFFAVRGAGRDQSKDEVAGALGIDRRLAGFHLDKLVEHGFLDADFRRDAGRSGPGAGRPPKRYRPAGGEVLVAVPERHYELLASLLLRAASDRSDDEPQEILERIGYEFGAELGRAELAAGRTSPAATPTAAVEAVVRLLSRYGFAARAEGGTRLRACACPFEEMAFHDPDRICGLDRSIWRGMLSVFAPGATLRAGSTRALGDDACVATLE